MRSVIELPETAKQMLRDERGNIGMIFGAALLPLVFFAGAGMDYGRALQAKTLLQAAADAAVVAASNMNGDADAKRKAAADIFTANATANGSTVAQAQLSPVVGANNVPTGDYSFTTQTAYGTATTTITVASTGITVKPVLVVPTTFMRIASINSLDVQATSLAQGSTKKLEIAMMVDLTGSMSWNDKGSPAASKISGLKTAATDFLNILFPNGAATSNSTRVAIIPFADYVNAGEYASAATGMSSTGGSNSYAKLTNLASTKQGAFSGNYAGTFSGMTSAQLASSGGAFGATGVTNPAGATNVAGATYSNGFCAASGTSTDVALKKDSDNRPFGVRINLEDNPSLAAFPWVRKGSTQRYRTFQVDTSGDKWDQDDTEDHDGFVPVPTSATGLTPRGNRTASWDGSSKTGPMGAEVTCKDGDCPSTPPSDSVIVKITSGGYWKLKELDRNTQTDVVSEEWEWRSASSSNPKFYVPLYTSYSSTSTNPDCTATVDQPNGQLISCVTERKSTNAYTDVAPSGTANTPNSGNWVGTYNQSYSGTSSKDNYSSDGKCWVAGRELPKIIPMTNTKQTLTDFFTNATVGGATPGHIGTAWAWYMLSPEWNTIFPAASAAQPYENDQVIKAAILMTDGEYNVHYATPAAATQALALCTAMKAKGIRVYTIGFGFAATAAGDTTSESNARAMLKSCATNADTTAFFPYDGPTLKQHLVSIGNQLNSLALSQIKVTQ